jgi:predicted nucleic acid-binding protein
VTSCIPERYRLYFLDTNILLYSISRDPAERAKRERAIALLDRDDVALSVQVLQEFYVQATRPTRPDRLPHDVAAGLVRAWTRFRVQSINMRILASALLIKGEHGFSYWDSAIIAAAQALGCEDLFSEDMAHGRQVGGVTITDPFR